MVQKQALAAPLQPPVTAIRGEGPNGPIWVPWSPSVIFMKFNARRHMPDMLHRAGVFPKAGDPCLEVGFGWLGLLAEMLSWGVRETDLHGIEMSPTAVQRGREILPQADLRVGSAAELPWPNESFRLVVASTVFTTILDSDERKQVAREITRVLAVGGAFLWYDFRYNNRKNPTVRKVPLKEVRQLFPTLQGEIRTMTLAPPLSRLVAPWSWVLATMLESIPFLRTHFMAVLKKVP